MVSDQTDGPRDDAADEPSSECQLCCGSIARFVEGGMPAAEREQMLVHVKACRACAGVYGEALGSAARLGRAGRERRLAKAAKVRRETHREMALSATGHRSGGGRRGLHQLRLVLLPALFALLVIQFKSQPERGTLVAWERGSVVAADQPLDAAQETVRIQRGTWCYTGAASAARLEKGGSVVRLGSDTAVRLEPSQQGLRLRLQTGHLILEGPVEVSAVAGVFRAEEGGTGRVAIEQGALVASCERGALRYVGPLGSITLEPGSSRSFEAIR